MVRVPVPSLKGNVEVDLVYQMLINLALLLLSYFPTVVLIPTMPQPGYFFIVVAVVAVLM